MASKARVLEHFLPAKDASTVGNLKFDSGIGIGIALFGIGIGIDKFNVELELELTKWN